jgi:hypothetical protein
LAENRFETLDGRRRRVYFGSIPVTSIRTASVTVTVTVTVGWLLKGSLGVFLAACLSRVSGEHSVTEGVPSSKSDKIRSAQLSMTWN